MSVSVYAHRAAQGGANFHIETKVGQGIESGGFAIEKTSVAPFCAASTATAD